MSHKLTGNVLPLFLLLGLCFAALPVRAQEANGGFSDPAAIRVLLAGEMETTLSSRMSGTLSELSAKMGQQAEQGSVLARFDCREGAARAKVAAAELAMARQNLAAKKNLRRLQAAGDLEVAMAATEVQRAEGARSMAETENSYCSVEAPFSGEIAKVHVKPFQTVQAGTPLFDMVSDGPLKVRLNVPSALLPRLENGMAVEVDIRETGKTYTAHVSAINARVDAVAQSIELEAKLDDAYPELVAGMSGVARLPVLYDH